MGPFIDSVKDLPDKLLRGITKPVDWANNAVHSATGHYMPGLTPQPQPPPPDTSWHDSMVRQANQSHADNWNADQKKLYSKGAK